MSMGGSPHLAQTRGTWRAQQRVPCKRREHQICQTRVRTYETRSGERVSGRSRQKKKNRESPVGEGKWARLWERASSGGRAEREAPCHCIWQRSGVATGDRKVRRMREHASLGARRERDVTDPSHSFQTDCAVRKRA